MGSPASLAIIGGNLVPSLVYGKKIITAKATGSTWMDSGGATKTK